MRMYTRFLKQVCLLLVIVAAGTLIDWAAHSLYAPWHVEAEYFRNKIIFGTLWGILGYYALRHILGVRTIRAMTWGVPGVIAAVLQTKYFYQGRDLTFVIVFLFLHYLMFLPFSWLVFRRWRGVFLVGGAGTAVGGRLYWGRFIAIAIGLEVLAALYFTAQYGWLH